MSTLEDRLREVMAAMGWTRNDLKRVSGMSSSVVSQWLGQGSKPIHSMGRIEAATAIERASGFSATWIAKGIGPKRAPHGAATHAQEPGALYAVRAVSPAEVVDRLAEILDTLPLEKHGPALQAFTALVTAPDSAKARAAVLRVIAPESVS
jgi:transcriptional regulator with XRE-family HTH domain